MNRLLFKSLPTPSRTPWSTSLLGPSRRNIFNPGRPNFTFFSTSGGRRSLQGWSKASRPKAGEEADFSYSVFRPRIVRPTLFLVFGTVFVYSWASQKTVADADVWAKKIGYPDQWPPGKKLTWRDLAVARFQAKREVWQTRVNNLRDSMANWPKFVAFHTQRVAVILATSWLYSEPAKTVGYGIVGLNSVVFLAWCFPRARPFMQRHFTHYVLSGKTYTMLTSVFSHASFAHLAFNSLALISFTESVYSALLDMYNKSDVRTPEATEMYHFIAFFITAGLFSSFVSHIAQAARLRLALRKLANPAKAEGALAAASSIKPSLGASGAIYSMVALTALTVPSASVNILFIPIAIPIGTAVGGMVVMDMLGIIRGWKMFDHWAHLGGAAFGALAYFDGGRTWMLWKAAAYKAYHELDTPEEERAASDSS